MKFRQRRPRFGPRFARYGRDLGVMTPPLPVRGVAPAVSVAGSARIHRLAGAKLRHLAVVAVERGADAVADETADQTADRGARKSAARISFPGQGRPGKRADHRAAGSSRGFLVRRAGREDEGCHSIRRPEALCAPFDLLLPWLVRQAARTAQPPPIPARLYAVRRYRRQPSPEKHSKGRRPRSAALFGHCRRYPGCPDPDIVNGHEHRTDRPTDRPVPRLVCRSARNRSRAMPTPWRWPASGRTACRRSGWCC